MKSGIASRRVFQLLRHLTLWCLLGFLAYWAWLDKKVYDTFESASWTLPAKIYARPLELYTSASLSPHRLVYELEMLGYSSVETVRYPGEFRQNGEEVEYYARGYKFWDSVEDSQRLKVLFSGSEIKQVRSLDSGKNVNLTRTEPIIIGSINPKTYEDRILVDYDQLPTILIDTLVAVEDRRFFTHYGFDFLGLVRAMVSNVRARAYVQGGSTLTQQLAKNFYLTRERTIRRKITELLMAISIELRFSKERILEVYANEIFLGQDGNRAIHGFGLASQFYFGKPLQELDVPAIASLVGMLKGPSAFNPRTSPERSLKRRNFVLGVMEKQGLISKARRDEFVQLPLNVKGSQFRSVGELTAFLDLVKIQLKKQYDQEAIRNAGLKIHTSLDLYFHNKVTKSVAATLNRIEKELGTEGVLQAASVVIDPRTGEILTLSGGLRLAPGGFNRALKAKRQVGSMIKPFIYALALSEANRFSLATTLKDTEVEWELEDGTIWRPRNFDEREKGEISLLDSLVYSQNLATVNLGASIGVPKITEYLKKWGGLEMLEEYPSILLGAIELTPLELTEMYTAFANNGFKIPLRAIREVTSNSDEILKRYPLKLKPAIDPATSSLVRYALTQVIEQGTGKSLKQTFNTFPIAGKTGTSDDNRDSWFVGFGNNRLGGVWVGRDDNRPTGLTGSSGALRVWSDFMRFSEIKPLVSENPPGIIYRHINIAAGKQVPQNCPGADHLPFHDATKVPTSKSCLSSVRASNPRFRKRSSYKRAREGGLIRWLRDFLK